MNFLFLFFVPMKTIIKTRNQKVRNFKIKHQSY